MYTEQELREIQDAITGQRKLSGEEIEIVKGEFVGKELPVALHPFVDLFATNPDLYRKLERDKKVEQYSLFGFFPETFGLVYGSEVSPEISFESGNRGIIGIVKHPAKKVVVKPVQNSREPEVARIADELHVGPRQHASLDGFLTEEFVEGDLFSRLRGDRCSDERVYVLGRRIGEVLSKLHSQDIYYNDTILTDDFGRSHVIVPETSPEILFDYGVAIRLDRHPNLTDEEIYNHFRTQPGVNAFLQFRQPTGEQVKQLVERHRQELQHVTKDQIMQRDVNFINEGLNFAAYRLGSHVVAPFSRGFRETYRM